MNATAASQTKTGERIGLSEWGFVGLVVAIVLVLTSLPYVYAVAVTPPDKQFMGIMLDVPDHAQYFSWLRELTTANLAANKMTPEPNQPLFFNLLWWAMGRMGSLLGVDYAFMFQVLRITATLTFLPLAYLICRWFLKERFAARLALLVIAFGGGLGWIWVALKYITGTDVLYPLDVYVAEPNTFLSVLGYPHFVGAALYMLVFYWVMRGQAEGKLRYAVWAGLFAQFIGWQHAYDLVSIYGVLGAFAFLLLLRDRKLPWYMIKAGLIIGVLSVWPALYSVLLTSLDPVWKGVLAQFANAGVYTPNLLHLPILMGVAFILAVFTLIRDNPLRLRGVDDNELFLRGWFLITFGLVYLPVDYQIHLLNGWQVPAAVLAVSGLLRYGLPWLQARLRAVQPDRLRTWAAIGLVALVIPTNLYLFAWRFLDLGRTDYPYYLYQAEIEGMRWLEQNAGPTDVVLASLNIGQYVPAMTGAHAYLAHWAQTLDFFTKSAQVERFYSNAMSAAEAREMLTQGGVDYIFAGPAERLIGMPPTELLQGMPVLFQNELVTIYGVNGE